MPNEKTHFIAGALVGATVNFIIQSAEMAVDYDRPFDWNEFFLCTGAGALTSLGPRLGRRPAAEISNGEPVPNLQPHAPRLLHLLTDTLQSATGCRQRNASLPLPRGEGRGEGEGSARKPTGQDLEIAAPPTPRHFFPSVISAGLIAYAISGKHTLKFSRTTRLALWVFGMSYLSHIALDCATPKRINLV
jgi:hypothetical protein